MASAELNDKGSTNEVNLHPAGSDEATPAVHVKVWDIPTRLCRWAIVCLLVVSWITADNDWMVLHLWSGLAVLTLLIFRIAWGLVGSTTARFSDFVTWPWTAIAYLRALASLEKPLHAGHNPAGGWMAVALIVALGLQVLTGLLSNDELGFNGPLAMLVSKETSDRLTGIHGIVFNCILVLVWMHLVATFFYLLVKGENLIEPMFTGKKHAAYVPPDVNLRFTPLPVALFLIALAAACVWWVVLP